MNILQIQDDLKNFSEEQLVKAMQQPDGQTPQFLVLSEMNRRKRMRDASSARQAQGQPTVAEEAIAAAGVPTGGIQSMAQALAPNSSVAQNTGVEPTRGMADGGYLGFRPGEMPVSLMLAQGMGPGDRDLYELMYSGRGPQYASAYTPTAPAISSFPPTAGAEEPSVPSLLGTGGSAGWQGIVPNLESRGLTSMMQGEDAIMAQPLEPIDLSDDAPTVSPGSRGRVQGTSREGGGITFPEIFGTTSGNEPRRRRSGMNAPPVEAEPEDMTGYDDAILRQARGLGVPSQAPESAAEAAPAAKTDQTTPDAGGRSSASVSGGVGGPNFSDAMSLIQARQDELDEQRDQEKWMALANFGMALMAGDSGNFGTDVGRAGLAATQSMRQGLASIRDREQGLQDAEINMALQREQMAYQARLAASKASAKTGLSMEDTLKAYGEITDVEGIIRQLIDTKGSGVDELGNPIDTSSIDAEIARLKNYAATIAQVYQLPIQTVADAGS